MKVLFWVLLNFMMLSGLSACGYRSVDRTAPELQSIKTSGDILVISDCPSTVVEITANVSDPSGVENVLLWYRIAPDQKFTSASMELRDAVYVVSLKGADFLGHPYGIIDFYISAEDTVGNKSQSEVDQSIQFLPCVNN